MILASASLLGLAACGSGSSNNNSAGTTSDPTSGPVSEPAPTLGTTPEPTSTPTPAPVATNFTLSGTAATGAALAGASIKVTDKNGVEVCSQVAAADGSYSCTIPLSATGPFVIVATLDDQSLVSTVAEAVTSTANITPLTHLIAARL